MEGQDIHQMRQIALVMALTANLNTITAGMDVENHARLNRGLAPTYVEVDFQRAVENSGVWGWNNILDLLNS